MKWDEGYSTTSLVSSITITTEMGLRPLFLYLFQVRAVNSIGGGEWSEVFAYVGMPELYRKIRKAQFYSVCTLLFSPQDWHCLFPKCTRSRLDRDSHIYDFCGKQHYKTYGKTVLIATIYGDKNNNIMVYVQSRVQVLQKLIYNHAHGRQADF